MPFFLLYLGLAALVVLVALTFVPRARAAHARRMSQSVGLALTPEVAPIVERAIATRVRAAGLGGIAGLALGLALPPTNPNGDLRLWVAMGGLIVGLGAGGAIGAFLARPASSPSPTRVARAREVTLGDYVMPIELTGARILVVVAAATALTVVTLLVTTTSQTAGVVSLAVVAVLALASLVIFEVAGRAIIARPSPAEDPTTLAWEDALRADTLRGLVTAPLTFGCVAVALSTAGAFGLLPLTPLTIVLGAAVPLALLAGAIAIAVVAIVGRPQRHYLRVLWPETAAAAR